MKSFHFLIEFGLDHKGSFSIIAHQAFLDYDLEIFKTDNISNVAANLQNKGQRVDQLTAKQFPNYSRAHIQRWIKDGDLLVNSKEVKSKYIMQTDDAVSVNFLEESQLIDLPEDIALDVIF